MHRRNFLWAGTLGLSPGLLLAEPTVRPHVSAGRPVFNVRHFGAVPDGRTICTRSVQAAIHAASSAGGGCVYVPPGRYLIGTIELASFLTLFLEGGSTLLGSPNVADYPEQPGPPGSGDANRRHLLFARGAESLTICGSGTIDGNGARFWRNKHRSPVPVADQWKDVITFDYEPATEQRPSPMVELVECRHLTLRDITLQNAAGWTVRPIACDGVLLDSLTIRNPEIGPNTDGLDITACSNVLVTNCNIATGDDAICLKSENPYGALRPTRNITITNCTLTTTCNGFKMGTATFGEFSNIVFSNSVIQNPDTSQINERVIGGVCIEMVDGGSVEGVSISNLRMQNVRTPLFIRLGARHPQPSTFLRDVRVEGIDASGALLTSSITGIPGLRPQHITVRGCRFRSIEAGHADWATATIPEAVTSYPEARMFGRLPAAGLYVRHAQGIRLLDLELIAERPDSRPVLVCDDVEDLTVSRLEASAPAAGAPLIRLRDTHQAFITGTRLPPATHTLVEVHGAPAAAVQCTANALTASQVEVRSL